MADNLSESEELELLQLQKAKAMAMQGNQAPPTQTFSEQAPQIAKEAIQAANPVEQTKQFFQTDPATMQRVGGPALPIVGGMVAGYPGAIAGEALRQFTGTGLAPDTVPKTALGRAGMMLGAGVMQEPEILNAIPGVPQATEAITSAASNALSKTGKGLANAAQVVSGGKAGEFIDAAKKGYQTYAAPSIQKAGEIFKSALDKLPGENIAPTMAEHIEATITPEASAANKFLIDMGKRLDNGELIDARQALKAKQALDDVIDTVPIWQVKRRANLFDLKKTFDDVLTSQSGQMKAASNTYRDAILKDNMTKPFPVNKHGEYSRLAGMLSTLGGSIGAGVGGHRGGAEGGLIGALAPLATAVALSPASLGLAATTGGEATRGLMRLGQNPAIRQALLQTLQKIMANRQNGQAQQ